MELTSKSQKKREALTLQAMGEQLVKLSIEQLTSIGLPQDLHAAVVLAKKISKHGARLRQMQYIGALMRKCDPKPVQEALERIKQGKTAVDRS
jgi:ribosome-associated protein